MASHLLANSIADTTYLAAPLALIPITTSPDFNLFFLRAFAVLAVFINHLNDELNCFLLLAANNFFVGIDDAHMNYKKVNLDYGRKERHQVIFWKL